MSTADPSERVPITTPSGNVRMAAVVDREWQATARRKETVLTVEVDGHRFRITDG